MLPEVIVYYQPLGYVTYQDDDCDIELAIPKGFKTLPNHQLLPSIKWPRNFDKQVYLNIQEFIQNRKYGPLNEWLQIADNTTFYTLRHGHISLDEIMRKCHDRNVRYYHYFSRKYIQEAVDTFYEPKGKSKVKK